MTGYVSRWVKELEELNLANCRIGDVEKPSSISSLKLLDHHHAKIAPDEFQRLRQQLPDLKFDPPGP